MTGSNIQQPQSIGVKPAGVKLPAANEAPGNPTGDVANDQAGTDEAAHQCRASAILAVADIQYASSEVLQRVKAEAGYGSTLNVWETNPSWVVFGKRDPVLLTQDLREYAHQAVPGALNAILGLTPVATAAVFAWSGRSPDVIVGETVAQAVRYLLLLRLGKTSTKGRPFKSSSTIEIAYLVLRPLLPIIVAMRFDLQAKGLLGADDHRHFSLLTPAQLEALPKSSRTLAQKELRRMSGLVGQGLWHDAPPIHRDVSKTVDPSALSAQPSPEVLREPHQPLPDEYAAVMGSRSIWIVQNLGPVLLQVGQSILTGWKAAAMNGHFSKSVKRKVCVSAIESISSASTATGKVDGPGFPHPPFPIRLSEHGKALVENSRARTVSSPDTEGSSQDHSREPQVDEAQHEPAIESEWPPRTYAHFTGLCAVLQGAHLFLVSMALAARQSESMDLRRDCVVYAEDGNWSARGRTFKLVQRDAGEEKIWELPEIVARALEQQVQLAELLEQMPGGTTLEQLVDPEFIAFRGSPPRQNSCRLHRTRTQGAAMKDGLGSIRTGIQGQSGGEVGAAGERSAGSGCA